MDFLGSTIFLFNHHTWRQPHEENQKTLLSSVGEQIIEQCSFLTVSDMCLSCILCSNRALCTHYYKQSFIFPEYSWQYGSGLESNRENALEILGRWRKKTWLVSGDCYRQTFEQLCSLLQQQGECFRTIDSSCILSWRLTQSLKGMRGERWRRLHQCFRLLKQNELGMNLKNLNRFSTQFLAYRASAGLSEPELHTQTKGRHNDSLFHFHWLLPPWDVELQISEGYLAFPSFGMWGSQGHCLCLDQ